MSQPPENVGYSNVPGRFPDEQDIWRTYTTNLINDYASRFVAQIKMPSFKANISKLFNPGNHIYSLTEFQALLLQFGQKRQEVEQQKIAARKAKDLPPLQYTTEVDGLDVKNQPMTRMQFYGRARSGKDVQGQEVFFEEGHPKQIWIDADGSNNMIKTVFAIVDEFIDDIEGKTNYQIHEDDKYTAKCRVLNYEDPQFRYSANFSVLPIKDDDGKTDKPNLNPIKTQKTGVIEMYYPQVMVTDSFGKKRKLPLSDITLETVPRADVPAQLTRKITLSYSPAVLRVEYEKIACKAFNDLLAVDPGDIDTFLLAAGKFAYIMAHSLFYTLGTAGITEWMLRSAAQAKGIDLGPLNYAPGISWDFKALLTPDPDAYSKWFKENVFVRTRLLEPDEKFSFLEERAGQDRKKTI